jgi:hypothetical protein
MDGKTSGLTLTARGFNYGYVIVALSFIIGTLAGASIFLLAFLRKSNGGQ